VYCEADSLNTVDFCSFSTSCVIFQTLIDNPRSSGYSLKSWQQLMLICNQGWSKDFYVK
jgi:hypothetical protein